MLNTLSRRSLLGTVSAGAALAALPRPIRAQEATDLNFVVWNYSLDTIQDNIAKFEEHTVAGRTRKLWVHSTRL